MQSDAVIDAHFRASAETGYHPSRSCPVGSDDLAAVDGNARVHSVACLRVVDASIMPDVVSGNVNAPTIMLAEKLTDAIGGRAPLAPSPGPYWVHPWWKTEQR